MPLPGWHKGRHDIWPWTEYFLSGPFHKYGDVVGEGFFVQTRREHRAYPPVICEVRATPSARKRPAEYVSGFMKWTTKSSGKGVRAGQARRLPTQSVVTPSGVRFCTGWKSVIGRMTRSATCGRCGGVLSRHAPAGLCPRCLLESAIGESPMSAEGRFQEV